MKEIGKLIELLNEYEQLNMCRKFDCFEMHTFENSGGADRLLEDTVISARYGFIGWLVENDKIDREKFGNSETKSSKYSDFELSYDTPREDYTNTLLMELAIQDEPIQFLIGILR